MSGVSRAGSLAFNRAQVTHLHVPTEIRGLQGPWEPSRSGLRCGAPAESLPALLASWGEEEP